MNTAQRLVVLAMLIFAAHTVQGGIIFQESFEGTSGYTVENGGFNPAFNTRFFTVLPQGTQTLGYLPGNIHGAAYFGGRDLNGFISGTPHRVTFSAMDVTAYENLSVALALSARSGNIFEAEDIIILEYSPDGGSHFLELDRFFGKTGGTVLSNGSGTLIESLTDYSYVIPGVVTQLVFRITTDTFIDSNEAFAFDNIRYLGDLRVTPPPVSGVPEPAGLLLLAGGLLALGVARRRKT